MFALMGEDTSKGEFVKLMISAINETGKWAGLATPTCYHSCYRFSVGNRVLYGNRKPTYRHKSGKQNIL